MLPINFIERRQSVKEITCDLIQVARAGASRTGRWWEVRAARAEMGGVGVVGAVGLYCFDGFFKGDAMGDAAT